MLIIQPQDLLVLLERPLFLDDGGAEDVDPALTALLVNAVGQSLAHLLPVLRPEDRDLLGENLVLSGRPGQFLRVLVASARQLLVALVALDHRLEEQLRDAAPLLSIQLDALEQLDVLSLGEVAALLLDVVAVALLAAALLKCWILKTLLLSHRGSLLRERFCFDGVVVDGTFDRDDLSLGLLGRVASLRQPRGLLLPFHLGHLASFGRLDPEWSIIVDGEALGADFVHKLLIDFALVCAASRCNHPLLFATQNRC